jgi:hypothetical protein
MRANLRFRASSGPGEVQHRTIDCFANPAGALDVRRAGKQCVERCGYGSRPAVNQFLLQYFINYNLKKGYYLAWQPIITANWEASSPNRWTVPYGGGIGRIMKVGFQPMNLQLQFFANPVRPASTAPWTMRIQVALLYLKLTKEQEKMIMEQKLRQLEQEQPKKSRKL